MHNVVFVAAFVAVYALVRPAIRKLFSINNKA